MKKNKGSVTVEAALVIPIVIIGIFSAIYLTLVLYERSVIQTAADNASAMGAASWRSLSNDDNLYWRLLGLEKNKKLEKIERYAHQFLSGKEILKARSTNVSAQYKRNIFTSGLEVAVEKSYNMPASEVLKIFGLKDFFIIKVVSYSIIDEPSEFIRNIEFAGELATEIKNSIPGSQEIGKKAGEITLLIKQQIARLIG